MSICYPIYCNSSTTFCHDRYRISLHRVESSLKYLVDKNRDKTQVVSFGSNKDTLTWTQLRFLYLKLPTTPSETEVHPCTSSLQKLSTKGQVFLVIP